MPITVGDVKLVASQVMDDVPEGGGAPTATVVQDGASNSLFNDISELDRAGGRVSLRKLFASVQTLGTEGFFGSNVIVAEPPQDPRVSVTIFSTGSTFDRRSDASSRVEAYLNAGPEVNAFLYENHIAGQRSIQLFARTSVEPPTIGHTLLLRKREGFSDQTEQYVRITRVQVEERTFTHTDLREYKAKVVTCDLSDALRVDFPGSPATIFFVRATNSTIVRDTVVADAATYYGVVPLAQPAALGDIVVDAQSVYTQLVPNARTETSVLDQRPSSQYAHTLATTPREITVAGSPLSQRIRIGQENRGYNFVTLLTPLPAPGSVKVTFRALGRNYTLSDDRAGNLSGAGSGTVNYLTGSVSVTLQALPDDRSAVMFYWGQNVAYTNRSGQAGFRAPEYSFSLEKQNITPGSLSIEWTSANVTKTATDNGSGKLVGDAAGEIVYATGMVYLRPTAMPDAGAQFSIAYTWATLLEEAHPGLAPDASGAVSFTFAEVPTPGTISVQWLTTRETSRTSGATSTAGSTGKSSMSNASSTNTTTTQTTMVDTTNNYRWWNPAVAAAYNLPTEQSTVEAHWNGPWSGTTYTVTTHSPVTTTTSHSTSGSASSSSSNGSTYSTASSQTSKSAITVSHLITDDGAGSFYGSFGTILYAGKSATLKVQNDYSETSYSSNHEQANEFEALNATSESTTTNGGSASSSTSAGGGGSNTSKGGSYGSTSQKESFGASTLVVRYQTGSPTPSAHTESYTPPGVSIDLCPYTTDMVLPGSVRFTWMGMVYEDFEGTIYRGRTASDPGIESGRMGYTSGLANMTDYVVAGSPTAFTLNSLWTRKPREHIANVTFSTPLSPIKPTGLVLSVLDTSGQQITATANLAGDITGTHAHGKIDYESGLVEIQFGDYVPDASLSAAQKAEWWYDANDIRTADGTIWRPWPIDPDTLRYNAVSYFYLPLDADILGLDPVRLPQDGRVPIFRSGGFAVVGHTGRVPPATVSNGQTINCARVRLSRVRVIGHDGGVIATGYSADLDAGTVTFTDVAGYSQPVTVEHRIEDMVMVAEVQINGRLSFTRQLTHDYPAPGSVISSAMVAGDLRARVSTVFDQATWTNTWSDTVIGAAANGTFNDISYPITVSNKGAWTERWVVTFTSTTAFTVAGEHVGVIAVGSTGADCAPLNAATGVPYFTIPALGWGLGWATGNVLRFNTVGAIHPVWAARTVLQGPETVTHDAFTLLIRGDVDNPA